MSKLFDKITRAHIRAAESTQFRALSGILAVLQHKEDESIPTACTNGWWVKWNPEWACAMPPKELCFVLLHEAGHCFFMHNKTAIRLYKKNPEVAAQAVDHVVNNFLLDCDPDGIVITMPASATLDRKYQGKSIFDVFLDLMKQPKQPKQPTLGFDTHIFDGSEPPTPEQEQQTHLAIEAGKRKMQDRRSVDEVPAAPNDFKTLLAPWLYARGAGNTKTTWRTPNRRFIHRGVYLPSKAGKMARKALFTADTSGSISGEELATSIAMMTQICQQIGVKELHVIYWDHGVASHEVHHAMTGNKKLETTPKGGGGTSFAPVLDYLKAQGISPDFMVSTTDGYVGDWGAKPAWPSVWVVSTDVIPPWGEVIRA